MGQYLAIGICTNFSVSKETFTIEEIESALSHKYHLPLYKRSESETAWLWELKEELFDESLTEFVLKQLAAYGKRNLEELTAALQACETKQDFMDLAEGKYHTHFQEDRYGMRDSLSMPFGKRLRVNYDCILLFLEGKIMMESWGGIFDYFANNIATANPDFPAAKAVKVYITG